MLNNDMVIINKSEKPMYLQIEPWADLLYLLPTESISVTAYSQDGVEIDYDLEPINADNYQILNIYNATEYFFVEEGMEIHHMEYGSNVDGWSRPLHVKSTLKKRKVISS